MSSQVPVIPVSVDLNRRLRRGSKASKNPGIIDRVRKVEGHSYNDVQGLQYFNGTTMKPYRESDLKYDLEKGWLEYASLGYEVKMTPRVTHDETEYKNALAEAQYWHDSAMLIGSGNEPMSRKEMLIRHDRDEWLQAEDAELASLRKLECWERVPRSSATKKPLNCGFVYKQKPAAPPLPARKKARLCIKGWNEDVSNVETFAPVVRMETVRTAFAHAAHEDLIRALECRRHVCLHT